MLKFDEFLFESFNINEIDNYIDSFNKKLLIKFKSEYWQNITTNWEKFLSYFSKEIGFIYFMKTNSIGIKKSKSEKWNSIKRACFYNSLGYAKYYNTDLAYGYVVNKKDFSETIKNLNKEDNYVNISEVSKTVHAFNIKDNKIIDPTILSNANEIYIYKVVDKSIWKNFFYLENDKNFNGGDFADFIYDDLEWYEKNGISWYLSTY